MDVETRNEIITEVAQAILSGLGQDSKGLVPHTGTGFTLHGQGGIFSTFGLNREIINVHCAAEGILTHLPLMPSSDTDPRFGTITGVTQSYGSQPTNECDFAPHAYLKGANLTARFGRLRFDTNTIVWNEVITRFNRGDFTDLVFLGSMLGVDDMKAGIVPTGLTEQDMLDVVTVAEMLVVGTQFQRELVRQAWQGNILIANEFPGLASQIATGQMDADIPGKLVPSLDSDVKDFQYADVCGTTRDIVEYVNMMYYFLMFKARKQRLNPVTWAIVMRPELWYELSACWPCRYLTNRCRDSAGVQVGVINDRTNLDLTTRMRADHVLPIGGVDVPVIEDDGIYESNSNNDPTHLFPGEYASSIFFVPLTILGRFPVTYREHLNYRSPVATANIAAFAKNRPADFWTDDGAFSWAYDGQLWCYLLAAKTQQRVILRTPWLAGRIDNVRYSPLQHLVSPLPDQPHFVDGGVSLRPSPRNSYAVWAGGLIP